MSIITTPYDSDPVSIIAPEILAIKQQLAAPEGSTNYIMQGTINAIINGDMSVRQLGDTFSSSGSGTIKHADLWKLNYSEASAVSSDSDLLISYENTGGATDSFCNLEYRIEDVHTYAGQQVTLAFNALSPFLNPLAISLEQNFGTGGSSSVIQALEKININTAESRYSVTFTIPSVIGKIIGARSYLGIKFWMSAGSSFNAITNNLGIRDETSFIITDAVLSLGATAQSIIKEPYHETLQKCQRYLSIVDSYDFQSYLETTDPVIHLLKYPEPMYYTPVVTKQGAPVLTAGSLAHSTNGDPLSYLYFMIAHIADTTADIYAISSAGDQILIFEASI